MGRKCELFLSDPEFRWIGEVLDRHRKTSPLHCAAISLKILTGCRKSEITCVQWSEVRGIASFFSRPSNRYLSRQIFPSVGWTQQEIGPESVLVGLRTRLGIADSDVS